MFDIGFLELCIIGIVALLVIGPERLPGAARTAGQWVGKARRLLSSIQHEIETELKLNEAKQFRQSHGLDELDKLVEDTRRNLDVGDLNRPATGISQSETVAVKTSPESEKDHG